MRSADKGTAAAEAEENGGAKAGGASAVLDAGASGAPIVLVREGGGGRKAGRACGGGGSCCDKVEAATRGTAALLGSSVHRELTTGGALGDAAGGFTLATMLSRKLSTDIDDKSSAAGIGAEGTGGCACPALGNIVTPSTLYPLCPGGSAEK